MLFSYSHFQAYHIPTAARASLDEEIIFLTPEQAEMLTDKLTKKKRRKKRKIEPETLTNRKWRMPIVYKFDDYFGESR